MAEKKKEKMVRLRGYDELDGMYVPESMIPKYENLGNGCYGKGTEVYDYKSKKLEVVIPEGVTKIAKDAFAGKSIKSITIPTTLTKINTFSFSNCTYLAEIKVADGHSTFHVDGNCLINTKTKTLVMGLHNSVIPANDSVTKIAKYAFWPNGCGNCVIPANIVELCESSFSECGMYNLTLPATIKKIGKRAFAGCICLQNLVIEEGITELSEEMFARCEFLKNVKLPESLRVIGKQAFYSCQRLENINIPANLESVERTAFCWSNNWCNGLNGDLVIPKNLKIGYASFPCASIKSISVEEGNPYYYCENNCLIETATKTLVLGCKNSIIPNDIKKIGDGAFYFALGLKKVVIPESVEEIGEIAFRFCKDLEEVEIPNSVMEIGEATFNCVQEFYEVLKLKKVKMPKRFEHRMDIFDKPNNINFEFTE